ncbi:MAG TPA: hypothetical protein VMS76_12470 [Planctomycetota bacterium]|nr:hypothetical protein [Planctomycetota bacterium]
MLGALLFVASLAAQEPARAGPRLALVPDSPSGAAPVALAEIENDLGAALAPGWIQVTIPLRDGAPSPEGDVFAGPLRDGLAAWRLVDGKPADGPFLVQLDVLARRPPLVLESGQTFFLPHALLAAWDAEIAPGTNRFAFYTAPPAARAPYEHPKVPEGAEDELVFLSALRVECVGPLGELYVARPFALPRSRGSRGAVLSRRSGAVLSRWSGAAVALPEEGAGEALPHALLIRAFAEWDCAERFGRIEIALCNGFTGQREAGGWNDGDSYTPLAATSTLFLERVELILPEAGWIARQEGPEPGRRPHDEEPGDLRVPIVAAGEGEVVPFAPGAFVVRSFVLARSEDAVRAEQRSRLPCVAVVRPARDERGEELASWRTVGWIAGIPVSTTGLAGEDKKKIAARLSRALARRIANPVNERAGGAREHVALGTLELEGMTLGGSTSGGYGIGTVAPDLYDAVRAGSADALRLLGVRWRDLSDRADCVWLNALEPDGRFGEPWLPSYGLARGEDEAARAPLSSGPLNFDVAPAPYRHASFWDFGRRRFEALPAWRRHEEAGLERLSADTSPWRRKRPHDWQHASRDWPALGAAWILGSPSARLFVRSLALAGAQARTLVPRGPPSKDEPFGKPMTGFTLLAAENQVELLGPGRGGSGAGRALGWILWAQAAGAWLAEDLREIELLDLHLRRETALLRRSLIEPWGVPEVFPPGGRTSFPLQGGAPDESAQVWHLQGWEMAITAYGLLAARHRLENAQDPESRRLATEAGEVIHAIGRFHIHLTWDEASGRPSKMIAIGPAGRERPERFPPPGEPILVELGGRTREVVPRLAVDSFYAQDLAALLAAETGDEVAAQRARALAGEYGIAMGQLRLWLEEEGILD